MTHPTLKQMLAEKALDELKDDPRFKGENINAMADKIAGEGIEDRARITARALEIKQKAEQQSESAPVATGRIQAGGKVAPPAGKSSDEFNKQPANVRLLYANNKLAGEMATVPTNPVSAAPVESPASKATVEYASPVFEAYHTGRDIEQTKAVTPTPKKPTPVQRLGAVNDADFKKWEAARKQQNKL
ncbi:MAG TPA: hypothetical protein VGH23_01600 [Rhizomicrobium sp.]|jgi:hypothetical protein